MDRIKNRQSNIELLRIITMIMIVAHHFALHVSVPSAESFGIGRIWMDLLLMGGKIGVDVFILIMGYFSVTSQEYPSGKVIRIWLQLITYSLAALLISKIFFPWFINTKQVLRFVFPIVREEGHWWFASTYFLLLLLSPFINRLLVSLPKRAYKTMLILLGIIWVIIPTFTAQQFQRSGLLWFMAVYAFGGYIRLHAKKTRITGPVYILLSVVVTILNLGFASLCEALGRTSEFWADKVDYLYSEEKLPIVLISVFLFLGFLKTDLGKNRVINLIAAASFGVYLVHNNDLAKKVLWEAVSLRMTEVNGVMLIPVSIGIIAAVYIASTAVELFRIYVIEKRYENGIAKLGIKINKSLDNGARND